MVENVSRRIEIYDGLRHFWLRFKDDKKAVVGLVILIASFLLGFFAPFISPYDRRPGLSPLLGALWSERRGVRVHSLQRRELDQGHPVAHPRSRQLGLHARLRPPDDQETEDHRPGRRHAAGS